MLCNSRKLAGAKQKSRPIGAYGISVAKLLTLKILHKFHCSISCQCAVINS